MKSLQDQIAALEAQVISTQVQLAMAIIANGPVVITPEMRAQGFDEETEIRVYPDEDGNLIIDLA